MDNMLWLNKIPINLNFNEFQRKEQDENYAIPFIFLFSLLFPREDEGGKGETRAERERPFRAPAGRSVGLFTDGWARGRFMGRFWRKEKQASRCATKSKNKKSKVNKPK